jgi:hypothetical protein
MQALKALLSIFAASKLREIYSIFGHYLQFISYRFYPLDNFRSYLHERILLPIISPSSFIEFFNFFGHVPLISAKIN